MREKIFKKRNLKMSKRVLAIMMTPILVLQMSSFNFLLINSVLAQENAPRETVQEDDSEAEEDGNKSEESVKEDETLPEEKDKAEEATSEEEASNDEEDLKGSEDEASETDSKEENDSQEASSLEEENQESDSAEESGDAKEEAEGTGEASSEGEVDTDEPVQRSHGEEALIINADKVPEQEEAEDMDLEGNVEKTDNSKDKDEVEKPSWQEDGDRATIAPVEEGKTYKAPQNNKVTVTFTKLPKNPGSLTIEEIELTKDEQEELGALSDKAYDITSDMKNGTFEYDLTLPKPKGNDDVEVKFADSADKLKEAKAVSKDKTKTKDDEVKIELDHFTTFFIATYVDTELLIEKDEYYQGDTVYVKSTGLSQENKFFRLAIDGPGSGDRLSITDCVNGENEDGIIGSYFIPSDAEISNNWKAELHDFTNENECENGINSNTKRKHVSFEVVSANKSDNGEDSELRICHFNGTGNYVSQTPATRGALMGHANPDHQDGNDIIPPIEDYLPDGQNWDSEGENIWNNDCKKNSYFNLAVCYEGNIGEQSEAGRFGYFAEELGEYSNVQKNQITNGGLDPEFEGIEIGDNTSRIWSENTYELNSNNYVWTLKIDGKQKTTTLDKLNGKNSLVNENNQCPQSEPNDSIVPEMSNIKMFVKNSIGEYIESSFVKAGDFVRVDVNASDSESGIKNVEFRIQNKNGPYVAPRVFVDSSISGDLYRYEFQIPTDGKYVNTHGLMSEELNQHTFWAIATDNQENYNHGIKGEFTYDNTAPIATIDGEVPGGLYGSDTNISVHAIDDNYLHTEFYREGENNPFKIYSGKWFGIWWMNDGDYRMVVVDKAGNSTEYEFTIDQTDPTFALTDDGKPRVSIVNGSIINPDNLGDKDGNGNTIRFSKESKTDTLYLNDQPIFGHGYYNKGKSGQIGEAFKNDGVYTLYTKDLAGNQSESTTFTIDTMYPDMSEIKMFVNGSESKLTKPGDEVKIQAKVEDLSGVEKVQIWVREYPWNPNNNELISGILTQVGDSDIWEFIYTVPDTYKDGDKLNQEENGNYFNFRPYDKIGNSHIGWRDNFTIDNTAPEGEFIAPNGIVGGNVTITVKFNEVGLAGLGMQQVVMRDGSGVVVGNWQYNIKTGGTRNISGPVATYIYTGNEDSGTLDITFDSSELAGMYNLRLFTKDQVGNGRSSIYSKVEIDNTAPVVSNVKLNNETIEPSDIRSDNCDAIQKLHLVSGEIDLGATIEDSLSGVSSAYYNIRKLGSNGCTHTSVYKSSKVNMIEGGENEWSGKFDTTSIPNDGEYTIHLVTKDKLGNKISRYVDILVDNTPPTIPNDITILNNQGQDIGCNGFTNQRKITVDWSDSSDSNFLHYDYMIREGDIIDHPTVSQKTGDIRDEDGYYKYRVRAIDEAGNMSDWTPWCGVTLDREDPEKPMLVAPADNDVVKGDSLTSEWSIVPDAVKYIYESYHDENAEKLRWHDEYTSNSKTANNVPDATFWWRVKSVDAAGNKSEWSDLWKVTVDNTAPTTPSNLSFSTIEGDDLECGNITNEYGIVAKWESSEDNNFSHYEYRSYNPSDGWIWNGGNIGDVLSRAGAFTVGQGMYGFAVRAVDEAGNTSSWTSENIEDSCQITYDSIAPVITFDEPATDLNHSGTVHLKATCDEECSYINFWWRKDGEARNTTPNQYHYVHDNGTNFEWDLNTLNVEKADGSTEKMDDGVYYLSAAGKDLVGNRSITSEVKIIVDNTAPNIPIETLTANSVDVPDNGYTSSETFTFNLSSSSDTTRYQLKYWNDISGSSYKEISPWNPTNINSVYNDHFSQGEGKHYFSFSACDVAGNCSDYSRPFVVTYDKTAPIVSLTAPMDVYISDAVAIEGSVTDNNPDHYYLVVKNSSGAVVAGPETVNDSSNFSGKFFDWDTIGVADGEYEIQLAARDAAGNRDDSVSLATKLVTVDNTLPTSTIDGGNNGDKVFSSVWEGNITGTATDENGVSSVELSIQNELGEYWNGSAWQSDEFFLVAQGSDIWSYGLSSPIEGEYTIKSHAIDNAGNRENTYTLTMVLDKTIPEVGISINPENPDGDNDWYDSNPIVTLTAADKNLDKIEYQIDSQTGTWVTYNSSVKLEDSEQVFYYRSLDKAGNYSEVGIKNVKVDTQNPDTVKGLDAYYDEEKQAVKLRWDNEDEDIDKVYVYRGSSRSFDKNSSSRISENDDRDDEISDRDVERGEKYYYKVVSRDEAGNKSDTRNVSVQISEDGRILAFVDEGTDANENSSAVGGGPAEEAQDNNEENQGEETNNGDDSGDERVEGLMDSQNNSGNSENEGKTWPYYLLAGIIIFLVGRYFILKKKGSASV